jgi:hypothetical protein
VDFGLGVEALGADLAAIAVETVGFESAWGGEGGRPTDGADFKSKGSFWFSRGFRNMSRLHHLAVACGWMIELNEVVVTTRA